MQRDRAFAGRQSRVGAGSGPVHLGLDSTGLELFGQGTWDTEKHGRVKRRRLKLHLALDATTGEIAAHMLTDGNADDAAQVPACCASQRATAGVTADGAYDGEPTYAAAAARQPDPVPDVVVSPRASVVPGTGDPVKRSPRDCRIRLVEPRGSPDIAERGRVAWQKATGYGRRALVETAVGRYKHLIGPKLRARPLSGQQGEVALAVHALNRMIRAAKPASVRAA